MGFRQYRIIDPGEFFVVGYDLSSGMSDSCAVQFLSTTKLDVPLVFHQQIIATDATTAIFPILEKIHDITGFAPVIAPERNAGGTYEIERLNALNKANKFRMYQTKTVGNIQNPNETRYGWDTNTATRPHMLSDLKDAIDKQVLTIYDRPTVNEMFSFIINKTSSAEKAQAEVGAHDDLIMSLAIAWQLYATERPHSEQTVHSVVTRNNRNREKWAIK